MFAIFSLDGVGLQTEYVAACLSLRDGQTDELLASENVGDNFCLELRASEVQNRRKTDDFSTKKTVTIATTTGAHELLGNDQLVEVVELRMLDIGYARGHSPRTSSGFTSTLR